MITEGLGVNLVLFLGALIVLVTGAQESVKRVHRLLHHYGYSDTFGGLVLFSVTTSFPEIFSHIVASMGILFGSLDYEIASATVLGANIGSDIVQQTFILGLVIWLMGGLTFQKSFLKTAYAPMIGSTLMCIILGWDGVYSRVDGLILFSTFIAYIIFLDKREHHHMIVRREIGYRGRISVDVLVSLTCFASMLVSAHFLLSSTQLIVSATGVGGSLIGIITLGVASASPEMFTALFAIREKAEGIALGTLVGSNITNPLMAIGGGALLSTYWVPAPLVYWDLPMATITAAMFFIYLLKADGKAGRGSAFYLMGLYFAYLLVRVIYFPAD